MINNPSLFHITIGTYIETTMSERYIAPKDVSLPLYIEGKDTGVNIVARSICDGTGLPLGYRKVFLQIVKR